MIHDAAGARFYPINEKAMRGRGRGSPDDKSVVELSWDGGKPKLRKSHDKRGTRATEEISEAQ